MNVVRLEDTTQVGSVRRAAAQPFECRHLIAESLKKGIGEFLGVELALC
jgi:hypothetical protein